MNNFGSVVVVVAKAWGGGVVVGPEWQPSRLSRPTSQPFRRPTNCCLMFQHSATGDWDAISGRSKTCISTSCPRRATRHRVGTLPCCKHCQYEWGGGEASPGPLSPGNKPTKYRIIRMSVCGSASDLATGVTPNHQPSTRT